MYQWRPFDPDNTSCPPATLIFDYNQPLPYNKVWNIPFEKIQLSQWYRQSYRCPWLQVYSAGYTDYQIEAGSPVTMELLPDTAQYIGGLNGNPTTPEPGKASYTFIMPDQHLHLSAIFQKVDDSININSESVKSATINMPADEINGTAELIIDDAEVVDTADFETAAGDLTITNYLDLSLNEVINKGHADQAWTTAITDLSAEMTVNLELTDELQGYTEYAVLREHEGAVTELASAYNPNTEFSHLRLVATPTTPSPAVHQDSPATLSPTMVSKNTSL